MAFWGDSTIGTDQLLGEDVDVLVFDYLAEVTMSILARARSRRPELGYATDFVTRVVAPRLRTIQQRGVKIVTNAGGLNPEACARAIRAIAAEQGVAIDVAAVTGDDLLDRIDDLRAAGVREMFSGAELPKKLLSANAYLGAFPIARRLAEGADIVVTGRCVDSALVLGPCIARFGWRPTDFDRLAAGSLAGHILECGAQASGGIFTDWQRSGGWDRIGYPIAEIDAAGDIYVSKARDTGGLVSRGTVSEQIVYEIGDPRRYVLPDVVCDLSNVTVEEIGPDRVRVRGARGSAPPSHFKVSATYEDGFRTGIYVTIVGIDAEAKAERVAAELVKRSRRLFAEQGLGDFTDVDVELLGASQSAEPASALPLCRTVVLKIAARHERQDALDLFLREIVSSSTSMAPGICAMGGGRPKVSPLVRLFSFLVPKSFVDSEEGADVGLQDFPSAEVECDPDGPASDGSSGPAPETQVALIELAWARSGDKGNDVNIGVIARCPEHLAHLKRWLTAERVADCFRPQLKGAVRRYELPGLGALNFVLHDALGGGGMASLRNDPQGKGFAQRLLALPLPAPDDRLPAPGATDGR